MRACQLLSAFLIGLFVFASSASAAQTLLKIDLTKGDAMPAGWEALARNAKVTGEGANRVLAIQPSGQVEWKFPVKKDWKVIRVLVDFRATGLKPGKETWQNARVMVRFDENMTGGKQAYGGAPSLSKDSDWQTQEMFSDVPADGNVLCVVPAVFADAGVMEIRRLEVEALGEEARAAAKSRAFMAGTAQMLPGAQLINGDFKQGEAGWTGWSANRVLAQDNGKTFARFTSAKPGWETIGATYRLPEGVRAIGVSVRARAKDPVMGTEQWQWPRVTVTCLDENGEHVGDWPAISFTQTSDWVTRDTTVEFPRDAKAFRVEAGLMGAAGQFDVAEIHTVPLGVGGIPLRVPPSFAAAQEAQKLINTSSTRGEIVLNGLWRFMPAIADATEKPAGDWGWMWVPGTWNRTDRLPRMAAVGVSPAWNAFDPETNARGWYERKFNIPQEWNGRAIVLDIQRVSTDAQVFVNGVDCGKVNWPGGTVDITSAAKPGDNTLRMLVVAVQTEKEVANLMGVGAGQVSKVRAKLDTRGIIGDVTVQSRPQGAHVSDVFVKTSTRKKQVTLDVELTGMQKTGEVQFVAAMNNEKGVAEKVFRTGAKVAAQAVQTVSVTFDWSDPRLWDLDQPNLYTLKLAAIGPDLKDEYSQRFGFREFWVGSDDGKQPTAQGQLPDRLKLFLNGTEFRMRPNCWDDSYELTNSMREGAEGYIRGFRYVGFNTAEIWPTRKTDRGLLNAREVWMTAADEMGMPLLGAGPDSTPYIVNLANWSYTWDKRRADYEKNAEAEVRKIRNHPSVLVYSTNANFFGHNQDQNPRYIGRSGWTTGETAGYYRNEKAGGEALAFIKKIDPTRPVFTHMGGQEFGDISATNHYLNFVPLQEREEWMAYWAQNGSMPYIAIEFGTPLSCSFMRGHMNGGFWGVEPGGAMVSEPQVTEFSAIYLGEKAYHQEKPEYRQLITAKFIREQLYNSSTDMPLLASPDLQDVEMLFVRNTWRSWRTLGISSMVPWSMAHGWDGTGTDEPVLMPAFEAGRRGCYLPTLPSKTVHHMQDPTGRRPNPAAASVMEVFADTMAWIAGPEKLGYPVLPVPASTNAPAGKGPPAFMSKDHSFYSGERMSKQIVLVNDARKEQPYSYSYTVEVAGKVIAKDDGKGTLKPSQTMFVPIAAKMPSKLDGAKATGKIRLEATIGKQSHVDEFPFAVFEQPGKVNAQCLVFDPEGATTRMLADMGVQTKPWDGSLATDTLVIGRKAMSLAKLPGDLAEYARAGGRVLVMAQDPQYARDYLGLRMNRQTSRRVYLMPQANAVLAGLDNDDLRDWRGEGTLIDPYTPTESLTQEAPYGWKWGNRGSVCSSAIEIPHNAGWRPLFQCEFDLAYSPLMELNIGRGYAMICALDLEGRTAAEPVAQILAQRILSRMASAEVKQPLLASYVGDGSRKPMLDRMGVVYGPAAADAKLILADHGADAKALRDAAQRGTTVVVLPQTATSDLAPVQSVSAAYPAADVPAWPEAQGVSVADLHWRVPASAMLLSSKDGVELAAGGQLGIERIGQGRIIYCQLDPDRYDADTKTYNRFTRWRQTRALAQVLANVGVSFKMDERPLRPVDPREEFVELSGEWLVKITKPMVCPPGGQIPDPGVSDVAKQLIALGADTPETGWKKGQVPGYWGAYGGEFTELCGEVIYRKVVEVPAGLAGKDLVLNLGPIDDFDDSFWDGQPVGRTDINVPQFYQVPRAYKLSPQQTSAGKHVLTVRIFNHKGDGGFAAAKGVMALRPPTVVKRGLYYPDWRADHDLGDDPARYKRW